jgi:hypothetical protein
VRGKQIGDNASLVVRIRASLVPGHRGCLRSTPDVPAIPMSSTLQVC